MSVQKEVLKKFIQLTLILGMVAGGYTVSMAQEDNRTLKNPNRSDLYRKRKKQNHAKVTRYTGNIRVRKNKRGKGGLAIHRLRARGKQTGPSKISQFTGNYRYRKPAKGSSSRKKRLSNAMSYRASPSSKSGVGRAASYRGRFRRVNIKAHRARKARKIASFMGKTTYRLRRHSGPHRPRNSAAVTSYRAPRPRFRRVANYNQRRLKRGFSKRNANPPAYQRNRSNKLQYNSREAKFLMPKPRKVDKNRRKAAEGEDDD